MKTFYLDPIYPDSKTQDETWEMKAPAREDIKLLHSEKSSIKVVEKGTERVILTVIRGEMPSALTHRYYKAITQGKAIQSTNNRGAASGQKPIAKVKKDGTVSNTTRTAEPVDSSIIGYFDRYPRINYCRLTAWSQDHPQEMQTITEYTNEVNRIYKKYCPEDHAEQSKIADATSPDFKLGDSVFTTITLNKNFRTHYHRDAGNLETGLACMSYIKTGKFAGGEVVMPNYGVAVKLFNYDLIIFNNRELHGNLPIKGVGRNPNEYERITSVFFYRKGMQWCGTTEEELERAKRNKGDGIIGPTTEDLNKGRWK